MATRQSTSDVLVLANAATSAGFQPKRFWADQFGHVQSYANWSVHIFGTGTYMVVIQGSLDGVNWVAMNNTNFTVTGLYLVTFGSAGAAVPYIRANVSSVIGGNVSAIAVGVS